MKCPKCNLTWNRANLLKSSIFICPGCNSNYIVDGEENREIRSGLKRIISEYGTEAILDTNKINALLMDFAPNARNERNLLVKVMREGVAGPLHVAIRDKNQAEWVINSYTSQLVNSIWITETAARYALMLIAEALGIIGEEELHSVYVDIDGSNEEAVGPNPPGQYAHNDNVLYNSPLYAPGNNSQYSSDNSATGNYFYPYTDRNGGYDNSAIINSAGSNAIDCGNNVNEQKSSDIMDHAKKALLFGILGVQLPILVFSILALNKSKKYYKASGGIWDGKAKAGKILGIIGLVESVLVIIGLII